MVRVLLIIAVLVSSLALYVVSSDISGKWQGTMHGPQGDIDLVFTFEAKGDSLSGSVQSPMGEVEISNGKINGDKFTFDISFNDMTINHECTVLGDSISVKATGMQGDDMEIILKRVNESK
jgi:hypothetical protein